jgi:hypothetical protein
MFERLRARVEKMIAEERAGLRFYVQNGYRENWAEDQKGYCDSGIEYYSTPANWRAYQQGKLCREKAVELATARALKIENKGSDRVLRHLLEVEKAPELTYVKIQVEWHPSKIWGSNPYAEIWTDDGWYDGKASGCGYDKLSSAVALALNKSPAVLKPLYAAQEEGIELPYGVGNGTLRSFARGVGIECFGRVFVTLGYKWECTGSGKMFDCYRVWK